jgi:hypothetical protein
MQLWTKVAIGAGLAFVGYQIWCKWGPQHAQKPVVPVAGSDKDFERRVQAAYALALKTGEDEILEQLYDEWKRSHYTPEQLATQNSSGAREAFKKLFGIK